MTKSEFILLVLIVSGVLLIAALCTIIFTCSGQDKYIEQYEEEIFELPEEEEIDENDDEAELTEESLPQVSHITSIVSRSSSMSGLGRIQGRVNVSEIDPINFENPDINVLRQMGVDQYLISYFIGEQFYANADYDRAIAEYTISINRNRDFTAGYISRGNSWMKKHEYRRAIEDYSHAIRLDNNRAELYNYRGFARAELSANNNNEMILAIEDFTRAISLNRNYIDALVNRSHVYYRTGNFDKTIEDCDLILRLEPGNAVIWNRRGSAWYRKEDDDRAIRDFTEAIKHNANYALAYYNRANAWHSKGEYERAAADYALAERLRNRH